MQIAWIDIASPTLRSVHQEWIRQRGAKMLPTFGDYEAFNLSTAGAFAKDLSASLWIPPNDTPVFRRVDPAVAGLLGGCGAGDRITGITSMVDRVNVVQPL